ncbi:MAG: rRNA maturation RNase YbeY [Burkholderiaceae bacterium]|nr:rRNA maturation RNase YbeY [Burkholderiaceae bacterium]
MPKTSAASKPRLALSLQTGSGIAGWPVHRSRLRRWVAASLARDAAIVLRLVGGREARALNRDYRDRDYATNVLTFVYESADAARADIAICLPVLEREARTQRKTLEEHLAHLVVHGVLHAQGMEHDSADDAQRMERREREVLRRFRVPDPYAWRAAGFGRRGDLGYSRPTRTTR